MNLGVTLKTAEKVFGPALPGAGSAEATLSAVRYAEGKGKKYAGVLGSVENAKFHVHFPTPVDWNLLATKKGTPDFVNDLRESGPQGEQGRSAQVAAFLERYEGLRLKLRAKQDAAEKKIQLARQKDEILSLRKRVGHLVGVHQVNLTVGSESFSLPMKINLDKSGKLKFSASL